MPDTIVESAQARLLHALRPLGSPERAAQEMRYQRRGARRWVFTLPWAKEKRDPERGRAHSPAFHRNLIVGRPESALRPRVTKTNPSRS